MNTIHIMKSIHWKFSILFVLIGICCGTVHAEQYRFIHDMRRVSLGSYGTGTHLEVTIQGLKTAPSTVEVEIIKDGELLHAVAERTSYNRYDEHVFSLTVASPRAGIVYRFSITDADGKIWRSRYFWKLQACQETEQDLQMNSKEVDAQSPSPELLQIAHNAKLLEGKLTSLDYASSRLKQLAELLRGDK